MDELADKSDNDLVSATRDLEAEIRKLKNLMSKCN